MPFERCVLLNLSVLRDQLTFAGGLVALIVFLGLGFPWWFALSQGAAWATIAALVSADGVENLLRKGILGYAYNPFVSSIGEKEGWMGPTNVLSDGPDDPHRGDRAAAAWELAKCGPPPPACPWWGDPGSGSFCR